MTISPNAPLGAAQAMLMQVDNGDAPFDYLTPDALLAYCQSRLKTLDATIASSMSAQKDRNQAMSDCSALINIMRSHGFANGHQSPNLADPTNGDTINTAAEATDLVNLYVTTKDPQVKQECSKAFQSVTGQSIDSYVDNGKAVTVTAQNIADHAGQIQPVDSGTWAQSIEDVKQISQGMSNSAELDMVSLQSLVSQRQLAIQLTTQLMQSYNDGLKTIAGNVGRT